jgi:hypothetical protein
MADETTTTTTETPSPNTKAQLQTALDAALARVAALEGQVFTLEREAAVAERAATTDPRDVMFGRLVGALEAQALLALAQRLFAQGASGQAERLVERAATLLG